MQKEYKRNAEEHWNTKGTQQACTSNAKEQRNAKGHAKGHAKGMQSAHERNTAATYDSNKQIRRLTTSQDTLLKGLLWEGQGGQRGRHTSYAE